MKYLLDTHTLLWAIFEPEKLIESTRQVIIDSKNEVFVSVISFWEISLKFAIGKLELVNALPEELPEIVENMGFDILQITANEVASSHNLPKLGHKYPFDRMIIWQAIQNKMKLISKDREFKQYKQFGLNIM